jgi:hypothetical protein
MTTPTPQQIVAGTNVDARLNENFLSALVAFMYGRKPTTTGLTWAYYGAVFAEAEIADGTVALTDNATNYIVAARANGAVTAATATTNWDNSTDYARLYAATTASGVITGYVDHRGDTGGMFGGGSGALGANLTAIQGLTSAADTMIRFTGAGTADLVGLDPDPTLGGGGASDDVVATQLAVKDYVDAQVGGGTSPIGRHAIYIAAGSMTPSATGGSAALATIASAANQPDITTLNFDTTTQEYAQFGIVMPKSWDEGTVTFRAHWSHAATTTNFGVVWDLQAVAVSDDDAIAVAFGTAQTSTDTGGTTNDLYTSPESSTITVAGTPAAEDMVFFRLSRVTGNGSDTMAIDARLHGITLYITTNAATDA